VDDEAGSEQLLRPVFLMEARKLLLLQCQFFLLGVTEH